MRQFLKDLKSGPIFWMGALIPVVLVLHWTHAASHTTMFVLSALAIVPLAAFLSHATEGVAAKTGDTIGGLLNATLGNLTEMVIFVAALRQGMTELIKASIAGAVVTNSLFMLGMSCLVGGLKHKVQTYNKPNAVTQTSLLFVVCIALLVPAIVSKVSVEGGPSMLRPISLGIAGLLMVIYALSLLFSLKTHSDFFSAKEEGAAEGPREEPEHH